MQLPHVNSKVVMELAIFQNMSKKLFKHQIIIKLISYCNCQNIKNKKYIKIDYNIIKNQ